MRLTKGEGTPTALVQALCFRSLPQFAPVLEPDELSHIHDIVTR